MIFSYSKFGFSPTYMAVEGSQLHDALHFQKYKEQHIIDVCSNLPTTWIHDISFTVKWRILWSCNFGTLKWEDEIN